LIRSPHNARTLERFERLGRRYGLRLLAPWHDLEVIASALTAPNRELPDYPPSKQRLRQELEASVPAAILQSERAARATSALGRIGLIGRGRSFVERLFETPELAELQILDPRLLLEEYHLRADRGEVLRGLWRLVTAEIWLRSIRKL